MAGNTIIPVSKEDANQKLSSNPATRRFLEAQQQKKAVASDNVKSLVPNKVKKSLGDEFKEGWKELTQKDTPEMAEKRKKALEAEREVLKRKSDQKAEGLAVLGGGLATALIPGMKGKLAAGAGGLLASNLLGQQHQAENNEWDAKNGPLIQLGSDVKDEKPDVPPNTSPTIPPADNGGGETTPEKDPPKKDPPKKDGKVYDEYIAKIAKQQGLGKYVNEDGTVDYDRLQKSKVGFQILNALVAGIGGAAAGAAGKDAPDMSKGMLAQQLAKRDTVVDKAKEAAQQEKDNVVDMATFTDKLGLQGDQQKEFMRLASNLSYDEQVRIMNYLKNLSDEDARKIAYAKNPYGAMSTPAGMFQTIYDLATNYGQQKTPSDERCKKFASRKIFN